MSRPPRLGVKQSGVVLEVHRQGERGGNRRCLHHPQPPPRLPDRGSFHGADVGRMSLDARRSEITVEQLIREMAGGDELAALAHELDRHGAGAPGA